MSISVAWRPLDPAGASPLNDWIQKATGLFLLWLVYMTVAGWAFFS